MLSNIQNHASFHVVGRIHSIVFTVTKANKEEMIQLRVVNKKGRYITILLFGSFVDQIKADIDKSQLKTNDPNNPWVWVSGDISEQTYEKLGKNYSETTLIGKEVIVIGGEKTKSKTSEFLDGLINSIEDDPDNVKF